VALGAERVGASHPEEGFDDHFAALYRPLVRYCRRLTQDADPEDLAQEAMTRAWPRYVEGRDMWPLVATIAKRLAIDANRRTVRGQVRNHVEAAYLPSVWPTPEEVVELHEERQLARRALAQLPPRYQRMLRMRDIDDRTYMDIATLEGTSLDVVRSTMRRARAALRAAYSRASEGAAAVLGLRAWAARRSGRLQTTLAPLSQQGLATLAGAVVVIATAAGIAGQSQGDTVRTTPSPAADAVGAPAGGNAGAGHGAAGLPSHGGSGGGPATGAATSIPPERVRPDKIVGPVGIGGNEYGRDRTEDSEIKIEFTDPAGQVVVGVYASPKKFLANPTEPLPKS
jgi:RNA polymerase sigma-70 factor (ECF subfamily)